VSNGADSGAGFTAPERWRLAGFGGAVLLVHVLGWGLFLLYAHDFGPVYAGAGALAYGFGLRHAFDADHISAIDDTTRLLIQRGKRPLGVGFFFSLGHSSVVFALCVAIAFGAGVVEQRLPQLRQVGGLIGATVSGLFLWAVGLLNLLVLVGLWRAWRGLRSHRPSDAELQALLARRGFLNQLFGQKMTGWISASWRMYPVGFLFGLGFDTASEVGLLAITAAATTQHAAGGGVPVLGILALPLIFAAGMSLMDTADGAFMARAYGWALASPARKLYYNLTTTALSVFVALAVGTVELLQVLGEHLSWHGRLFEWIDAMDFERLGYWIVGAFVVAWGVSVALYKLARVEERFESGAS
jgi:high-affinity nickel-transport protein